MKKQISKLMKNKTPFAFVIKILILIGISYFLIQLSNEAKRLEERKYIPELQNPYDCALKYIGGKYTSDWKKLGHVLYKADWRDVYDYFEMVVDIGALKIDRMNSFSSSYFLIERKCKKDGESYKIRLRYGANPKIEISHRVEDEYISYDILYENGEFVRNQEMEEYFGITTDEVIEWAESSQHAFEEELQKMHIYQIDKARKRRRILTNIGLIAVLLYIRQKWKLLVDRIDKEDKPTEQCLGEIIVNTINKFSRWKYVLCGGAILFSIYMLRPIISSFILFGMERPVNICVSYGISSIIVAFVGYFILVRNGTVEEENKLRPMIVWRTIQMAVGCILGIIIIRLGMMLVSDFYSRSLRFYIVDGTAWFGAVFLIVILRGIKFLVLKKRFNSNKEKAD